MKHREQETRPKEVSNVSTQTVNKVVSQRLPRGTTVIVADSAPVKLRGKTQVVTSKGPVKCNKGGRCAGEWCVGLAVFVADAKAAKKDKKMGWRANTVKVCLTHLKDEKGVLILAPKLKTRRRSRSERTAPPLPSRVSRLPELDAPTNGNTVEPREVTWGELAVAHRSGNIDQLAALARSLKAQAETLKSKVIDSQTALSESLTRT
jgi:hypothetical protein